MLFRITAKTEFTIFNTFWACDRKCPSLLSIIEHIIYFYGVPFSSHWSKSAIWSSWMWKSMFFVVISVATITRVNNFLRRLADSSAQTSLLFDAGHAERSRTRWRRSRAGGVPVGSRHWLLRFASSIPWLISLPRLSSCGPRSSQLSLVPNTELGSRPSSLRVVGLCRRRCFYFCATSFPWNSAASS